MVVILVSTKAITPTFFINISPKEHSSVSQKSSQNYHSNSMLRKKCLYYRRTFTPIRTKFS